MAPPPMLAFRAAWQYLALIPLAMFGGQVASFATGTMAANGWVNPVYAYTVFVLVDIVVDSFYYLIGLYASSSAFFTRGARRVGFSEQRVGAITNVWRTRPFRTALIAKYSMALLGPMLILGGVARLPARTYYSSVISVTFVQYAIFMLLGYFFGAAAAYFSGAVLVTQILVVLLIITYVLIILSKRAENALQAETITNEAALPQEVLKKN